MSEHWSKKLEALNACEEAVEFARQHRSLLSAWNDCECPDWMLWLISKSLPDDPTTPSRRKFSGCVNAIAKRSLKHAGEYRARIEPTIRAVARWTRSDPHMTLELLSAAGSAAWSAAWSAAQSAAGSAGRAAWSAESAAGSAAWSARSAAWSAAQSAAWSAAWSAGSAAGSAAESAAESAEQKAQCRIIRKHYPAPRIPKP